MRIKKALFGFVLISVLFLCAAILFRIPSSGTERNIPYPAWEGKIGLNPEEMEEARKSGWTDQHKMEARLAEHYGVSASVLQDPARMESIVDNLSATEIIASLQNNPLNHETVHWPLVSAPGRMDLPAVLIQSGAWDGDFMTMIRLPDRDLAGQWPALDYLVDWMMLVQRFPEKAFEIMASDSKREEVTTIDLIRSAGARGYFSQHPLRPAPRKEDWAILHASKNPCYRTIALEFFASVPQTEEEGLALSRECLLQSCSYFELEAIGYLENSRGDAEKKILLLREYLDSHPLRNDGTGYWSRPEKVIPGQTDVPLEKRAFALFQLLQAKETRAPSMR